MFLPIPLNTCTPGYKQNLRYTLIFTQFLQWFAINWWPLSAAKLQSVQIQPCHALVETITMAYGGYNIPHLSHIPHTALYTIQLMPSTRVWECIIAIYCSHHFFIKSRHKNRNKKISKAASDPKVDVKRCLHEPRDVDPSAPPQSANGALADPLRDPSATWAAEHGILTDHGFGHVWLHHAIWRFPKMGVPKNGWFEMGNPISKWMIWRYFHCRKPP